MKDSSLITKRVEKRGDKWVTVHCHGPKKGQVIAIFPTKERAMAQHRAIMAHKSMDGAIVKVIDAYLAKQDKTYIQPEKGDKPPEGISVQRGPRGGVYYEAEDKSEKFPTMSAYSSAYLDKFDVAEELFRRKDEALAFAKKLRSKGFTMKTKIVRFEGVPRWYVEGTRPKQELGN